MTRANTSRRPEDDPDAQIREAVRTIGEHARRANLDRAARLTEAVARAGETGIDHAERAAAADIAHQLVGSAGTFGFAAVSELAGELHRFFIEDATGDLERLAAARRQLADIEAQLRTGRPGPSAAVEGNG